MQYILKDTPFFFYFLQGIQKYLFAYPFSATTANIILKYTLCCKYCWEEKETPTCVVGDNSSGRSWWRKYGPSGGGSGRGFRSLRQTEFKRRGVGESEGEGGLEGRGGCWGGWSGGFCSSLSFRNPLEDRIKAAISLVVTGTTKGRHDGQGRQNNSFGPAEIQTLSVGETRAC